MKKIIIRVIIGLIICLIGIGGYIYYKATKYSYNVDEANSTIIYISTNSNFEDVCTILKENNIEIDNETFSWIAEKKKYKSNVKPGKYRLSKENAEGKIENTLQSIGIIDILRSGVQVPVKVTFNNIRYKKDLAEKLAQNLEITNNDILSLLNDHNFCKKYGFNTTTIVTMFLPDTYEFKWNTSVEDLIKRFANEYKKFWNDERKAKAKALNLSQSEVSILASIVQKETNRNDEKKTVAGVYLNRLKKGMLLQADPTLVYAVGDFTIRRVLNKHKEINSKYNTYKYKGLPPGPICIPSKVSINAVLDYEDHEYLFFCARPGDSGYHDFAKTYAQHKINARKYRKETYK